MGFPLGEYAARCEAGLGKRGSKLCQPLGRQAPGERKDPARGAMARVALLY